MFEFLWGGADGAAVLGGRDFPQLSVRISGVNDAGMAGGNVAVDLTVDEENRDSRCGHGIFRGNVFHVEVVLQAGAKECDFDERA